MFNVFIFLKFLLDIILEFEFYLEIDRTYYI